MVQREIMLTKLHSLIPGSTDSAGRWIYQQSPFLVVTFMKNAFYESLLRLLSA
jgi:hypothetical protein